MRLLYRIPNPSKAIKYPILFVAICFYEAGFTVLLSPKSKKRNKLEVEDDIRAKNSVRLSDMTD